MIDIPKSDFEKFDDAKHELFTAISKELRLEKILKWLNNKLLKLINKF